LLCLTERDNNGNLQGSDHCGKTDGKAWYHLPAQNLKRQKDVRNMPLEIRQRWHTGSSHISLSRYLISLNGEEEVRETILHEIAHALVGYSHGHDRVWKLKAMEIGCTPHRLDFKAKMPEGKIAAVCPRCKKVVGHRHRRSQNMHRHVHRGCGTRIVWVNNNQREIDRAMQMPIPEKQPTTPLEQLHALLAKPHRFVRTNPPARTVVKTKAPEKVDDIVNL